MKLRKLLLSVLVSGVSLGSAAAQQPILDPVGAPGSASPNASKHIGDDAAAESDSDDYRYVQPGAYAPPTALAPMATSYQPRYVSSGSTPGYSSMPSYSSGGSGSCGGGCGAGSCGTNLCGDCYSSPRIWFDAETLLWWGQDRNAPPLLATAPAGVSPVPGNPGVTTVVGGSDNGINNGILPGYRLSSGMYFGPDQSLGWSGRVFGIYRNTDTITRAADSTGSSVGLPIFDPLLGAPSSYNVVQQPTLGAVGSASIISRLDLVSTDSSLRYLLSRSNDHRVELLGGYTYLRLRDSLNISTRQEDTITGNGITDGTVTTTTDTFGMQNKFNGGHIGLQTTVRSNRLTLTTMGRVSLGNMNQSGLIAGGTVINDPGTGQTVQPGGVYAQTSNIGTFDRNTFAFIPELGLKGGLRIRNNLSLTAGYTFLYISQAALASNQIDPIVDTTQRLGNPSSSPAFNFRQGSMWFQGVDLGLNYTF